VFHECREQRPKHASKISVRDGADKTKMNNNFPEQLNNELRSIEASASAYDAGNQDEAVRIATSLIAIAHHTGPTTSLLAHLRARLTRLMTSVDKPPYPQDFYSPLADVLDKFHFPAIHVAAQPTAAIEPTRFRPMLERKKLTRQVQAPDWWGSEPVIIQHGKKVTRKVIALWATDPTGPLKKANEQYIAALRQMAYEVLKSPELLKLAGR
jgi:hypothetical protein